MCWHRHRKVEERSRLHYYLLNIISTRNTSCMDEGRDAQSLQYATHAGSDQDLSVQLPRLTKPFIIQRPLFKQKASLLQHADGLRLSLQGTSGASVSPSGYQHRRKAVERRGASSRRIIILREKLDPIIPRRRRAQELRSRSG